MKRRYGVFHGLVLSLFSSSFYRDVARNWGGIGFVYLLLLLTVTWIPVLAFWQQQLQGFINTKLADTIKEFPNFTIKNGKVSSEVDQPYTVNDPKTGKAVFVLDTTGKIDSLDKTPATILITETKLFIRDDAGRVQTHDLGQIPEFEFTPEWLQGLLGAMANWFGVAAFPFVMVGSVIRALFVMLFAAIVGLIFKAAVNPEITFSSLMRLAAMGITLPTYVDTACMIAGIALPLWFLLTIGITAMYVVFGARAGAYAEDEPMRPLHEYDDRLPPPSSPPPSDAFRR